ncbi:MAG: 2-dehydropantoate 2-reductase [Deltaproteobacteria bacterium]|nr:2-dehydropantoate 2-reductase [Deltaproteobacteria bacterium]
MMKFLVVGPGAMGCLFAARLKMAGHDVVLLDCIQQNADIINKNGLRIEDLSCDFFSHVPAVLSASKQAPDVTLICVKSYDTRQAAEDIRPWLNPEAVVLTLQNGLGNVEILEDVFGKANVLGGVTAEGATLLGPGHVRHAGEGETVIGPEKTRPGLIRDIVNAFNSAGFRTRSAENVDDLIWGKLVINVGINALAALTGLRNGTLPTLSGTISIMEEAVSEAVAVAHKKGINLPYASAIERVLEVCRSTSGNIASMLQDVMNKRTTEIEAINGAIVREGKDMGIATPVNATLARLVSAVQETYRECLR